MNMRALWAIIVPVLVSSGCGDPAGPPLATLAVATDSLPRAVLNGSYSATVEATGGDLNYTWSVAPGTGSLPTGVSLTSGGNITGVPTTMGIFNFAVSVASGDDQTAQRTLSLTVAPVLEPQELCSEYPDYAIATFAEPQLERRVREFLGISAGDDLTCGRLAELEVLELVRPSNEPPVTSLLGLQNLVGLRSLWLSDHAITDLNPLSELTSLVSLQLDRNGIADISALTGLTGLTGLELTDNSITDVSALGGLRGLEALWLGKNSITDVSALGGRAALKDLQLNANSITDISPLTNLTALTTLDLRSNSITDVTVLSGLTSLSVLWLTDNSITDISALSSLTSLLILRLDNNSITDISPLGGLIGLGSLRLSGNPIADPSPLGGLTGLDLLLLENSSITDIGFLSGMTAMLELHLSGNSITDLSPLASLTRLQDLYLDSNPALTDIQPLLDNPGLASPTPCGAGTQRCDHVGLRGTSVSCTDVAALEEKVVVFSDCP